MTRITTKLARVSQSLFSQQVQVLSERERTELDGIKHAQRRLTFVAGRFVVKSLLASEFPGVSPCEMTIQSATATWRRPQVEIRGQIWGGTFSVSHTCQCAAAVTVKDCDKNVGVDLVKIERRPASFARTWFAEVEREGLQLDQAGNLASGWAAKEAAFKALNRGESFRPQEMIVSQHNDSTSGVYDVQWKAAHCRVQVSQRGDHVLAIAVADRLTLVNQSA